jgi:hypothetical protein
MLKHGFAGRSSRIQALLAKEQVDPERVQVGQEAN